MPAILCFIASACAWVMWPAFTSSASVWPTASWNAALTLSWLTPRSLEKCVTNSLHALDEEALDWSATVPAAGTFEPFGLPRLKL